MGDNDEYEGTIDAAVIVELFIVIVIVALIVKYPGRSGFVFHSSHNFKALRDWLHSGRVWVAGLQSGASEDKPSVQLLVVEDCLRA